MYQVAYDVSDRVLPLWVLGIAFGCAVIGVLCLVRRYVMVGVGAILSAGLLTGTFVWQSYQLIHLRKVLKSGKADVVEGKVRDFHPLPTNEHGSERFCVSDKCFIYARSTTPGFNRPQAFGGSIREGAMVRIHFVGNSILRVEIK